MDKIKRMKTLDLINSLAARADLPLRVYTDMDAFMDSLKAEELGRKLKNEVAHIHIPLCRAYREALKEETMTDKKTVIKFKALQGEALALFREKNADYGDSFREDGILGVMIRAKDKLNRLITLARKDGERAVKTESIRETLIDFSNYALMAVICHEDGWEWEDKRHD